MLLSDKFRPTTWAACELLKVQRMALKSHLCCPLAKVEKRDRQASEYYHQHHLGMGERGSIPFFIKLRLISRSNE
jgi:hypothetical protein